MSCQASLHYHRRSAAYISCLAVAALALAALLTCARPSSAEAEFGFLTKWGYSGTAHTQFNRPYGVTVDSDGYVYISDSGNDRIQKFDSDGNFKLMWGWGVDDGSDRLQVCTVSCQMGKSGPSDGQFNSPRGIAADRIGNIYVADGYNRRIQKFSSDGTFQEMWGWGVDDGSDRLQVCTPVTLPCQMGIGGSGDGQFYHLGSVSADSEGNVYIADTLNRRIQKFATNGRFLIKWGGEGSGDSQFSTIRGVVVDQEGNVYVSDSSFSNTWNHRIQKFDSEGAFQLMWGWGVDDGSDRLQVCTPVTLPCQMGIQGSGDGQLSSPAGVTVDPDGNIYVADTGNKRIQKFDPEGNFLAKWGEDGIDSGQFSVAASGIATDSESNVYVTDGRIDRVQKFGELPPVAPPQPPRPQPPSDPPPQPPPPSAALVTVTKPKKPTGSSYNRACNLSVTSPKIKTGKSPSVEISAKRRKLSSKQARRIFTRGLVGHVDWGKVSGKRVICKKIEMAILEKRGKRYYVPGTKIRVSKKRLEVNSFYRKTVRFLRGKKVGKLAQRRLKGKRRTKISFTEFRSKGSKLRRRALKNLRKRRYRGNFVVIYTAEVNGITVKKTVHIKT